MAGHSRSKDGVASLAYVPAIHVFDPAEDRKTWMPATSAGMTAKVNVTFPLTVVTVSVTRANLAQ
jgi:hypothetical protein